MYPPVVYLRPCASATLEITGHYDDGVARDLSAKPGLTLTFAAGNAAPQGTSGIVLNLPGDDALVVGVDGVDSGLVPIRVLAVDDLTLCGVTPATTTTVPSSTTTTTTAPAPSTTTTTATPTTSTLPPACQADADCDDGDACTTDTCTPGGCDHAAAGGLGFADCLLSVTLAEPLCPAGEIDPKLERFATKKLERALALVRKATAATRPKRGQRQLEKARQALGKISKHEPGTTTDECLQLLAGRIDAVLAALSPAPPEEPRHTIGGTVAGLEGTGLVLHESSGDEVAAGSGPFTFPSRSRAGTPTP